MAAQFSYRPLDPSRIQIRVLQVHAAPESSTSTVHCTIKHVSLLDRPLPQYEAMSYAWGDPSLRCSIILDGFPTDVPASSEQALRQMRMEDNLRTIWIDAICINQRDVEERSQQVAMMADIYRSTVRVLVYLGPPHPAADQALQELDYILRDMYATSHFEQVFDKKGFWISKVGFLSPQNATGRGEPEARHVPPKDFPALMGLYERAWFSRLWVAQEVALAPASTCFCGDQEFDLIGLLRAAVWIEHKQHHVRTSMLSTCRAPSDLQRHCDREYGDATPEKTSWRHFAQVTTTTRKMNTTDSRDRVFAVLGLVGLDREGLVPTLLSPDYTKSKAAVYRDATRFICEESQRLGLLASIHHRDQDDINAGGFTSWAVRWQRSFDGNIDPIAFPWNLFFLYDASDGLEWAPRTRVEAGSNLHYIPDVLRVQGFTLDKVAQVSDALSWEHLLNLPSMTALLASATLLAANARRLNNKDFTFAPAATLVAGCLEARVSASAEEILEASNAFSSFLKQEDRPPLWLFQLDENADQQSRAASRYMLAMHSAWMHRRFFLTESGYIGLGPKVTQKGDVVAILIGGPWPFILRLCEASCEANYQFLGQCYVHGVMDGEAARAHQDGNSELERFDLV